MESEKIDTGGGEAGCTQWPEAGRCLPVSQGHAEGLKGHSWKVMKSDESEPEEEKPDVRNDPKLADFFSWVWVKVKSKRSRSKRSWLKGLAEEGERRLYNHKNQDYCVSYLRIASWNLN